MSFSKTLPIALLSCILGASLTCKSGSSRGDDNDKTVFGDCLDGKITVYGEAPIYTSMDASEGKAKEDACRTAVEKCIGTQVASYSGVGNGQSVANEIFTKANGMCRNGQILGKNQYDMDTIKMLRLTVRYEVSQSELKNQIDQMQKIAGNPKLMILIREEYNLAGQGKRVESFSSRNAIAAAALRDFFVRKDYSVIDSSGISLAGINEEAAAKNPEQFPEDIKERAAKAGADILVIGSLEANPNATINLSDESMKLYMKSYKATGNITLLALWGKSKVLGEFNNPVGGAQTTDLAAAQMSVKRFAVGSGTDYVKQPGGIAKEINRKLSDIWSDLTRNNVIVLNITGLDQKAAGGFRDDLKIKTGVKEINPINETDNSQEWEVTYPGRSFALADTISWNRENPKIFRSVAENGKKPSVVSVTRGEIKIRFD
ncbi:MAG: hypothetical protein JNM27_17370 [Leptospirales bacterium]|nr:hypothetical protein [Leptospirales bacterium]